MTTDQITNLACVDCTIAIHSHWEKDRRKSSLYSVFSNVPCRWCGTRLEGYRYGYRSQPLAIG